MTRHYVPTHGRGLPPSATIPPPVEHPVLIVPAVWLAGWAAIYWPDDPQ